MDTLRISSTPSPCPCPCPCPCPSPSKVLVLPCDRTVFSQVLIKGLKQMDCKSKNPCVLGSQREDLCLRIVESRLSEARLGRSNGGAGVLERPGFDQSQLYQEPRVEEGGEMGKLMQKRNSGGGDRYRVLLLDHEKHTESRVTSALPKAVPTITVDEARKCFFVSREKGVGIVTVTVKEHAEFYAQMMARGGLRSGIEPDADTM